VTCWRRTLLTLAANASEAGGTAKRSRGDSDPTLKWPITTTSLPVKVWFVPAIC
jgi:hypothetical protein